MYNNQDSSSRSPSNNSRFDDRSSSSQRNRPEYRSDQRQLAINAGNASQSGSNVFPVMQLMDGSATAGNSSNFNMNAQNVMCSQQGFVAPNMQGNTMMMMSPGGSIIPFNFLVPSSAVLDPSKQDIKKATKKRRRKAKDRPKRPLSAYNIFFKAERENILKQIPGEAESEENDKFTWPGKKRPPHGKISFEELAKTIGARWKSLDESEKAQYKEKAKEDLGRYAKEMTAYEKKNKSEDSIVKAEEGNDQKRRKEGDASPSDSKKKKSSKKATLQDQNSQQTMEIMNQQAMRGNMVAVMGGNIMVPMLFNPGAMSNFSQQQNNLFKQFQHPHQQQQQVPNQAAPLRTMGQQYDPSTATQSMNPRTMVQTHSFDNECVPRPSRHITNYHQSQQECNEHFQGNESSIQEGETNNMSSYDYNYNNMNLNEENNHGNDFHFPPSNGSGPDDTIF